MRTPSDIYREYRIMPSLGAHQLRVAGVAQFISDRVQQPLDSENVVLACLFHDMGNIIKSDLPYFPQFLEPEGLEYWEGVKQDFIQRYGQSEHEASIAIAEEIGLPAPARELIGGLGFSKLEDIERVGTLEMKICEYADMRVGPHGVLSMEERLAEGKERYSKKKEKLLFNSAFYNRLSDALRAIEHELMARTALRPEDISDAAIAPIMHKLGSKSV